MLCDKNDRREGRKKLEYHFTIKDKQERKTKNVLNIKQRKGRNNKTEKTLIPCLLIKKHHNRNHVLLLYI